MLGELERWVQAGLQPDLTLWFDIAPALAAQRRAAARAADRFEGRGPGVLRARARRLPGTHGAGAGSLRAHRRRPGARRRPASDRRRAGRARTHGTRAMSAREVDAGTERYRCRRAALAGRAAAARAGEPPRPRPADAWHRRGRPVRAGAGAWPRLGCARTRPCRSSARPCGVCASCRLVAARSHPDLLVLVARSAARGARLEWRGRRGRRERRGRQAEAEQGHPHRGDACRDGLRHDHVGARPRQGRRHPSGRTDEPGRRQRVPEDARGAGRRFALPALLGGARPPAADHPQPLPGRVPAARRRARWPRPGSRRRASMHPKCCSPAAAVGRRRRSNGRRAVSTPRPGARCPGGSRAAMPRPFAAGRCARVVDALQQLCHDAISLACAAEPRFFPRASLVGTADRAALLRWWRGAGASATDGEHPWNADLALESLVEQGREALKTARSAPRREQGLSLHSDR